MLYNKKSLRFDECLIILIINLLANTHFEL